jgi:trimethylamine corrinoid protein
MLEQRLFEEAKQSIIDGERKTAVAIAHKGLEAGIDPSEFIEKGFIPGILEIGQLFEDGEVFLPEVMMAADAIKEAVAILNERMEANGQKREEKGKILLATVEGDLHDIGKGIVASLLVANGFEVIDLGRDVANSKIIEKAIEYKVDMIGTSALLTTTMTKQQELEKMLKEQGLKEQFKTIVGGAPVTSRWANKIGADAFAESGADGVRIAFDLLKTKP